MRLKAKNAGRLVSTGHGRHVSRVIPSWELIFVLKSRLDMFVGKEEITVHAGECLLLPPGIRHGGLTDYTPELSFYWVHFQADSKAAEEELKATPYCFPAENVPRLSEYFRCILSLQEENPEDRTGMNLLVTLIFHEAVRKKSNITLREELPFLVQHLSKILTLRFREPLSTSSLAAELKCNPDYLGRLWQKYCHSSITETLNMIRIRHAAQLLIKSNLSIAEIAYESGFNSPAYFRRRFFKVYAMLPGNYRRLQIREFVNTE